MGMVCVALLMALGSMGGAYGLWSKTLNIAGTAETGMMSANVSCCDGCTDSEISCSVVSNEELQFTVNNADVDVHYYCDFNIANTGTIPVKIQSITKSGVPGTVTVDITGVAQGDQIEQEGAAGDTVTGTVDVYLADITSQPFTFTVTIEVVQWNLYVP